jgi:predicted small metal-binding protein
MKRALNCFCGAYLEGDNDEELLNWIRAHLQRKHPDMQLTDEQIRQMVAEGGYDTPGKAHQK